MTDPEVCAGLTSGPPVASVEALTALRRLLDATALGEGSRDMPKEAADEADEVAIKTAVNVVRG
jgi:hypothetical protein